MKVQKQIFVPSLDTFRLWGVNSFRWKISKKGAHCMSNFNTTILIFSPDVAGTLPYRSAPIDR
jgi:hypothetical protein